MMYLGIDVGGTKTLVASLSDEGVIQQQIRLATPKLYSEFLSQLQATLGQLEQKDFKAAGIGIPASELDRAKGVGVSFGNLPWRNVPVARDVQALAGCPLALENDAKLAALSESRLEKDKSKVLYVTIGTGIGIAVIADGEIDTTIGDGGGRLMLLERDGRFEPWESFASGHAIYERFGQKASDIDDDATWQIIAHDLCLGLVDLIALVEPDILIIGGGVGTHFHKYDKHLNDFLHDLVADNPLLRIPPIKAAERPEQAVVYGCYDLAKSRFG